VKQSADPYKYFRIEAREILEGLTRGLLDLERAGGSDDEIIGQCFRLAHTLKGAARVVKQLRIGEIAHAIEDALAPYRETGEPITVEYITELLRLLDIIRSELAEIEKPAEGAEEKRAPRARAPRAREGAAPGEQFETLRIEIDEMDAILDGISEAAVQLGPLRTGAEVIAQAHRAAASMLEQLSAQRESGRAHMMSAERWLARTEATLEGLRASLVHAQREVGAALGRIESEFGEIKVRASTLRLVPASAAFGPLELGVRDAADWLGKQVDFEATGGETRLEGHILSALRDALLHVVRNAVDHGIEQADERIAAGKPTVGRVSLRVERRGSRVAFICKDDGRGVDLTAVRRSAANHGLIDDEEGESLSSTDALMLIFRPGVSTSDVVTEISGRGVGLDVVREITERYKGEIRASSEAGVGTTIEIIVPMSLSSLTVLTLTSEGMTALVPLDAVCGTMRLQSSDIIRNADTESILYEGQVIPFTPLAPLLRARKSASAARHVWSAVVLQWGGSRTALGVDRLLGTTDVIVKPLPAAAGPHATVVGASFDAQGDPQLVLDPQGLVGVAQRTKTAYKADLSAKQKAPILVIDDSLTTRMLEQSILESAGYEVHLASSGEEGLKKASARRYALFIVDVEMPGINGFEFVARAKADAALARVPVIMVTSLASAADRRRGAEVGVDAYIVKGEFDQKHFVQKVAELLGMVHA
jgi:two-component system chemotaxis sensor kinase CheA